MDKLKNAVPASLRKPVEVSRFDQSLMARVQPAAAAAAADRRAAAAKNRFAPMPQEPEDARMTGATRSLRRRLLALNVPGTLGKGGLQGLS